MPSSLAACLYKFILQTFSAIARLRTLCMHTNTCTSTLCEMMFARKTAQVKMAVPIAYQCTVVHRYHYCFLFVPTAAHAALFSVVALKPVDMHTAKDRQCGQ